MRKRWWIHEVSSSEKSQRHFRGELLHQHHYHHHISEPCRLPARSSQLQTLNFTPSYKHPPKMAQPQIRSLYRRLLRELPSTPQTTRTQHQKLSSPSHLQQRIRSTLSTSRAGEGSSSGSNKNAQGHIQQGEQFIQYVQAQRTYATLLERYNPGMGMTEEERVRLSARRVGMNLPVEFGVGNGEGKA
jgi:ATP synthase assembly factor FMC1